LTQQQRAAFELPGDADGDEAREPGAPPEEAASVAAKRKAGETIDKMVQQTAGAKAYLRSLGNGARAMGRPGGVLHVVRGGGKAPAKGGPAGGA
jgi:hypothetical protein